MSTGGPDLLKWGLPGGGINLLKFAPTIVFDTILGLSSPPLPSHIYYTLKFIPWSAAHS